MKNKIKVHDSATKHTQKVSTKTHKYEISWKKYGFITAKRKVRQAKQTVLKQNATIAEQALKGSFIALYQMVHTDTPHCL